MESVSKAAQWLLGPETSDEWHPSHVLPRWIFLRCLGLIYFSAFYSFLFQIKGLIGPQGILPAQEYLAAVPRVYPGLARFWFAPTLFWFSSSNHMLMTVCWLGLLASVALTINVWPRGMLVVCFVCFLSLIAAAQDFSSYQSDGMLLEAGFISLFFAPSGSWPKLGAAHPPSRASLFLLRWEWFRIYFESGVVKLASGDYSWRHFTAMDDYYQNCPLPSWPGWYVQHLPHWFHAGAVGYTFVAELGLCFLMFLPRRWKIACFCIVTPFQISIILTANYTFLNYLVLCLGFLLLDDRLLRWLMPQRWKWLLAATESGRREEVLARDPESAHQRPEHMRGADSAVERRRSRFLRWLAPVKLTLAGLSLGTVFYVTSLEILAIFTRSYPLPAAPVRWLEPFRIANQYGLFAVMTHERYEIEFQGSTDGVTWRAYPFRYKPQSVMQPPGIYAPYQPRFEWNLWFASLESWRQNTWVVETEERLLRNDPDVLALFAGDPFSAPAPTHIRVVVWQYWFTTMAEKHATGAWWKRKLLGAYAPSLEKTPEGHVVIASPEPVLK
ncbi:MAG TPA: lipase maturation factor family protein [Terriglobales bacterium]|nr:lipase maturation factor family protein [Terriglobales bacterium]